MGAHSTAPRFKRARSILTVAVVVASGFLWAAQSSYAVHDTGMFELEGNVVRNAAAPPPYDWTDLFNADGSRKITPDPVNGPILGSVFVNDTDAVDTTYFSGGTKIDDPIHNMGCGGPAANDKTSMDYVYAAMVQIPAGAPDNAGHQVLYLAVEKQAAGNGGDNAFGFWLFKDNTVGCSGSGSFSGAHTDGDLFIDGTFTNGGGASDVEVRRWNGNDITGSLGAAPVATGGVCGAVANDQQCAIANGATITSGPWRSVGTMAANTFVEAGIDLTALLGADGGCFSTFLADSQSSQSTSSQPKDYAGGTLDTCVPPDIDTTATPGGSTNPIGVANQHDVATLSAVGGHPAPTGTISFFLCKPAQVTAGGCETGGTQVGSAVTIAGGSATSANASGSLTTTVGQYCWRAEYSPDTAGAKFYSAGSHTNAGTECFTVVRNTTLIGTAASSQTVGAPIHDTATLSGATANAAGTITFKAWGPSDAPSCTGNPVFTSTVNVNGNGNYGSGDFTPGTAGKYYWIATYSGDDNNLGSAGSCGDPGETSTIGKKTTLIGTAASSQIVGAAVHDTATLSGATAAAGGTITFQAWGPSDTPDCSGNPVFSSTVNVNGNGDYQSGDFTAGTAGKYYWIATYSGDTNNLGSNGTCGDQGETSTIGKKTTLIATAASSETIGAAVHDVATLSGGLSPTGTITFKLFGPSASPDCSGTAVFTSVVNVDHGNGDYNSGNFIPATAGSYYWTASYSGDVNNLSSDDACGAQGETSVLVKRTTGITTAATNATVGSPVHDIATLSGATANAGGTITFHLYGPSASPNCSGTSVFDSTVNVNGNGDYNSGNFTPATAGSYYWIASYSGDVNNLASSGACGDSGETTTIGKQPTSIATVATSGTLGDAVHDVATLSGGHSPTGSITFNLYGPSASPNCSGIAVFTATVNVSGNGDYNSGNSTPSAAGSYYWIASYSGDVNNQPSSGTCGDSGETSTLAKRPTAISTAATSGTVGDAVHDVATLSGGLGATGTITFNLYGPSASANCTGLAVFTTTVNVSHGNGDYNSGTFTPTTAGSYYWIASYSGDGNNLPSSGVCGDQGETSTLAKQPTGIVTTAASATIGDAISDSATLSGGFNPTGSITFSLYGPSDTPNCAGAAIFVSIVQVTGNGIYGSDPFTPVTAGSYYWIASYSGDVNNVSSAGSCGNQGETSLVGKKTTLIGTAASSETVGAAVHDVATLSGATAHAGGTITFKAWGPSDTPVCTGAPAFTSTVNVDGPGNYNSGPFIPGTAGLYYWIASYSGDVNNLPSAGSCGDQGETSTIGRVTTLIGTAASSETIGAAIHDVATLSGATGGAGGTITFNLYGPSALPDCTGQVVFTSTVNVDHGDGDYNSGNFTPGTAGSYYWIASYSGDVNNQPSSGACGDSGETSTIGKQSTSIATVATSGTFGDAIHDVATLSGGHSPTGTITFNLYGPSASPSCTGSVVFTATVNVNHGNGDYNSGNFTPSAAGSYYWIASYSGDVNNDPSSGTCGDSGETSTLAMRPTSVVTAATSGTIGDAVHDVATLSGGLGATGTITFNLYGPSASANCSGSVVFTSTVNVDHGNGDYNSGNFTPTTAGNYYWIASYSGDGNNLPSAGTCGDQGETSTLAKQPTGIVTTAASATIGDAISDSATLSGGFNPTGSITFSLYGPSDSPNCSTDAIFTSIVTVIGNGIYSSDPFTPVTAGNYYWIASYSGDANNVSSSGACGDQGETPQVGKKTTLIGTAASSQTVGTAVHDVATLSGATAHAGGTITFKAWGPSETPVCTGAPAFTSSVNVDGPGDYNSGAFIPDTAGLYYWIASYSGDVNNLPSSGLCGDEGETSTIGKKTTVIGTDATSETIGGPIHDQAGLLGATGNATGTITFNLYGPSETPDCTGDPVFTDTVDVDGAGTYLSGDFTPSTAGDYYWIASYSGDVNNLPSTGTCGDEGETSTIDQRPTSIGTASTSDTIGAAVHDVATLSGATDDATGTITFSLYGPSATPDCTSDPVFTDSVDVAGPGDYTSGDFTAAIAGSYYWVAAYSGDVNNLPSTGACGDDGETSGLGQSATNLTTHASSGTFGGKFVDTATLTGATADATGTITFNLYGPSDTPDCSGTSLFTSTVEVAGPGNYKADGFTPTEFGHYYWTASYSGDVNNLSSEEPCGSPHETSHLVSEPTSVPPPPTPPTTPPAHGTSGTGTPVQAELALVLLLLGAGGLLLLLGRRRRGSRQM